MDLIVGFVLAGGRSSRMGASKALMCYPQDKPMILAVADVLETVCREVHAVVKPEQAEAWPPNLSLVREEAGLPHHPLSGVVTALSSVCLNEWALLTPCDTPYLNETALRMLVQTAIDNEGAVASDGERVHPLIACLPKQALSHAVDCLEKEVSVRRFASSFVSVVLPKACLRNINRPADLEGK